MDRKNTAINAVERLKQKYPDAICSLEHGNDPFRLLVMGRLSAQCTDARVNIVCKELFEKFPTAEKMALAPVEEIEKLIFSCGLYRTKARDLKGMADMVVNKYEGRVPDTMEELLTLPGVGRKIANLILGDVYKKPAIVADTHCIRISARLGLCGMGEDRGSPLQVERELSRLVPEGEQADFCHRLVDFGREVCSSRSPDCKNCILSDICPSKRA